MSAEQLPTAGRVAVGMKVQASGFVVALSRGDPAWDNRWTGANPPSPPIFAENVLDVFGYCRPTLVDFVKDDAAGRIKAPNGARYSVSSTPTRLVRVTLSIPVGTFAGQVLREIGVFIDPTIDPDVLPGKIDLEPGDVLQKGRLFQLHWRPPILIEDGDHFVRNLVVRL